MSHDGSASASSFGCGAMMSESPNTSIARRATSPVDTPAAASEALATVAVGALELVASRAPVRWAESTRARGIGFPAATTVCGCGVLGALAGCAKQPARRIVPRREYRARTWDLRWRGRPREGERRALARLASPRVGRCPAQ